MWLHTSLRHKVAELQLISPLRSESIIFLSVFLDRVGGGNGIDSLYSFFEMINVSAALCEELEMILSIFIHVGVSVGTPVSDVFIESWI